MNVRYITDDTSTIGSHPLALSQLKHVFRCSNGANKLSAVIPGVTSNTWETVHFVQIAEVFWVGKGLCHCLKILDKFGSSAMGKNAEPSSTCEAPKM